MAKSIGTDHKAILKKMNRPDLDEELKAKIQAIYIEHEGRYGYRCMREELMNRGQVGNGYYSVQFFGEKL